MRVLILLLSLFSVASVDARCLRCIKIRRPIIQRPVVVRHSIVQRKTDIHSVKTEKVVAEADIQTILAR